MFKGRKICLVVFHVIIILVPGTSTEKLEITLFKKTNPQRKLIRLEQILKRLVAQLEKVGTKGRYLLAHRPWFHQSQVNQIICTKANFYHPPKMVTVCCQVW